MKNLKIFTSQYIGNQSSFDFNSKIESQFVFQTIQCRIERELYFYISHQKKVIISTTMDCMGVLKFCFCLEITQKQNQYIFIVKSLQDIVREKQQQICSPLKLSKRLRGEGERVDEQQRLQTIRKLFLCNQTVPSYFHPIIDKKQLNSVWIVPRYMKEVEVKEGCKIKFGYEYNNQVQNRMEHKTQLIEVTKLVSSYPIQEVKPQNINSNSQLIRENYLNLLHISQWYRQANLKQVSQKLQQQQASEVKIDKLCYICMQSKQYNIQDDKFNQNILVNPCKCKGGTKYVHLKCIVTWINQSSSKIAINQLNNHKKQPISCPAGCKYPFSQYLLVRRVTPQGKKVQKYYHILGENKQPYMQLNNTSIKISSNQEVVIGGQQCFKASFKLKVNDKLSYAKINYNNQQEKIFIQDTKSQFGALIRNKNNQYYVRKQASQRCLALLFADKFLFYISVQN